MAGRLAVTPGNKKFYTYLRINLHMLNEVILSCFFPFLLVQVKDFNIPIWNWTEIVHKKQVKLYSCYDATGISDYITMAIYGKGLNITK